MIGVKYSSGYKAIFAKQLSYFFNSMTMVPKILSDDMRKLLFSNTNISHLPLKAPPSPE
jgi:hypothetical protein